MSFNDNYTNMIIYKCKKCSGLFWYVRQVREHLQSHFLENKPDYLYYLRYDVKVLNKSEQSMKRELSEKEEEEVRISSERFNKWMSGLRKQRKEEHSLKSS